MSNKRKMLEALEDDERARAFACELRIAADLLEGKAPSSIVADAMKDIVPKLRYAARSLCDHAAPLNDDGRCRTCGLLFKEEGPWL